MSNQPDPAEEAACMLQELFTDMCMTDHGRDLATEIIRDSYAPLLAAKDKQIAELVAVLDVVRAEFCDSCDYQPCYDDCDGYVKLDKLLAKCSEDDKHKT